MIRKFDGETSADELLDGVDLDGMRVLVTGVSAGLALSTIARLPVGCSTNCTLDGGLDAGWLVPLAHTAVVPL